MRSPLDGLRAARALGWSRAWHFLRYRAALRSGWLRLRTPPVRWPDEGGDVKAAAGRPKGRFFFGADEPPITHSAPWAAEARRHALAEGEAVLSGRFRMFGLHQVELGFPPPWNVFPPLPGGGEGEVPADRHWTEYDLDELPGDVKTLWECSRFSWAMVLSRAYRWTGEARFAEGFWRLLESWRGANPPHCGPQWISAQEVALRALALTFARLALDGWFADRPERARTLAATVAVHAERIPPTLAYARAQNNNHLLAEAVGLYTAGLVFPDLPRAGRWRRTGRRWLERGLVEQIGPDGGYVQHSTNYQRFALELGLWGAALAERNGEPLGARSRGALRDCARLLRELTDPASGRTPNFGPNDGAHLLPLSACAFQDYRPALQAAAGALEGVPAWEAGPWDETAGWLGLEVGSAGRSAGGPRSYPHAGLELLGQGQAKGVLRAAAFSSRPGHQDQLHLDLWYGRHNVALDAGTFLYNGRPPWDNRLADAAVHNGPVVDGSEPMRRVGRFLWLDWSSASVVAHLRSGDGRLEVASAEHDGYQRLAVLQRRTVIRAGQGRWSIVDDLHGRDEHNLMVAWLLPDAEYEIAAGELVVLVDGEELRLAVSSDRAALYRAGERVAGPAPPFERPQWGWISPTYALREPGLHWVAWTEGRLPQRLRSDWSIGRVEPLQLEWREGAAGLPALSALQFGPSRLEVEG